MTAASEARAQQCGQKLALVSRETVERQRRRMERRAESAAECRKDWWWSARRKQGVLLSEKAQSSSFSFGILRGQFFTNLPPLRRRSDQEAHDFVERLVKAFTQGRSANALPRSFGEAYLLNKPWATFVRSCHESGKSRPLASCSQSSSHIKLRCCLRLGSTRSKKGKRGRRLG